MSISRSTCIAFVMLLSAFARKTAADESKTNAFMQAVVTTYQTMTSYQDSGTSISGSGDGLTDPSRSEISFSTKFRRPDRFAFSWTDRTFFAGHNFETGRYKIWSDAKGVWSQYPWEKNPERDENFNMAVAGATGISHGLAHQTFRLLSNDVSGFRFDHLNNIHIDRTEEVDGVECLVISGTYPTDNNATVFLWIGTQDHLIRRGQERECCGSSNYFHIENIRVNQDIAAEEFSRSGE